MPHHAHTQTPTNPWIWTWGLRQQRACRAGAMSHWAKFGFGFRLHLLFPCRLFWDGLRFIRLQIARSAYVTAFLCVGLVESVGSGVARWQWLLPLSRFDSDACKRPECQAFTARDGAFEDGVREVRVRTTCESNSTLGHFRAGKGVINTSPDRA